MAQASLLGADADGNGVRDDVDNLIAKDFGASAILQKAVEKYAAHLARSTLFPERQMSDAEASEQLAVYFCASDEMERISPSKADNWNQVITAKVLNTEGRLRAFMAWQKVQPTATSLDLEKSPCDVAGIK